MGKGSEYFCLNDVKRMDDERTTLTKCHVDQHTQSQLHTHHNPHASAHIAPSPRPHAHYREHRERPGAPHDALDEHPLDPIRPDDPREERGLEEPIEQAEGAEDESYCVRWKREAAERERAGEEERLDGAV